MRRVWTVVAAVALVALPPLAYSTASAAAREPAATVSTGLPDRLDGPWWWTPTVEQAPPGRTPLVVGGSRAGLRNPLTGEGTVDLVGRDRHTLLPFEFDAAQVPGERLLLSPDGSRLAYPDEDSDDLEVRDLSDGSVRRASGGDGWHVPMAWAPDGRRLMVARGRTDGDDLIGELDLDSGRFTAMGAVGDLDTADLGAAYSGDGRSVAVQLDHRLHLFEDGRPGPVFDLPGGTRLAGKGAWRPYDRGIVLVRDGQRSSRLLTIDPGTGDTRPGSEFAPLTGVLTQRLLGWKPNGHPVVVAYHPESSAPADPEHPTEFDVVRRLELLELEPGGGVRRLLAPQEQLPAIDVADQALAADPVPGGRAPMWPVNPVPAALATLLLVGAAVLAARGGGRAA